MIVPCDLAGDAVILELGLGVYYGLNEVGAAHGSSSSRESGGAICERLVADYDVERARCEQTCWRCCSEMVTRGSGRGSTIRWRRLLELDPIERHHPRAAAALCSMRVGSCLLLFRRVQACRAACSLARALRAMAGRGFITWRLPPAARHIPFATCLPQALAAQWLLARAGYRSELKLGIAPGAGRPVDAHAWLELDGEVVIGGPDVARFTPLR
ncbi:MAG: lasso peptide biosynthesis B2 protein [Planctomycetota bacterium]